MRILWSAMLFSQLLLLAVMLYLRTIVHRTAPPLAAVIGLGVMSTGVAIVSLILPKMPMRRLELTRPRPGDPAENEIALRALPMARSASILGCALSEAVSLNGFALGFLGVDLAFVAPFFAVGILLTLSRYPSVSWILAQLKE